MTKAIACKECKFANKRLLKLWEKGQETPFCSYPGHLDRSEKGECISGRTK